MLRYDEAWKVGSSPLARGLRGLDGGGGRGQGIIPARAGFTARLREGRDGLRIIPARAGFTRVSIVYRARDQDHPRSRGVYRRGEALRPGMRGSSPLARGLRKTPSAILLAAGIIPARAGFTGTPSEPKPRTPDHPRSRGVYENYDGCYWDAKGSSPLARGLPNRAGSNRKAPGIIPARAGFTRSMRSAASSDSDHPRSRGVYRTGSAVGPGVLGSSPLARGLRRRPGRELRRIRIIPARAGFTPR